MLGPEAAGWPALESRLVIGSSTAGRCYFGMESPRFLIRIGVNASGRGVCA